MKYSQKRRDSDELWKTEVGCTIFRMKLSGKKKVQPVQNKVGGQTKLNTPFGLNITWTPKQILQYRLKSAQFEGVLWKDGISVRTRNRYEFLYHEEKEERLLTPLYKVALQSWLLHCLSASRCILSQLSFSHATLYLIAYVLVQWLTVTWQWNETRRTPLECLCTPKSAPLHTC
jgi:hypothetical protein